MSIIKSCSQQHKPRKKTNITGQRKRERDGVYLHKLLVTRRGYTTRDTGREHWLPYYTVSQKTPTFLFF